ncbi:MAG TPA: hypothetical protein VJZ72_04935 [Candidatus Limnocylindrales bacterium]|nr:hypothetical protein [Candidatus Limnocylindrales bacterium]
MAEIERTGFADVDRLIELVARTRLLLDWLIGRGELPEGGADFLASETLPHLDHVHAGFLGSLRTEAAPAAELRHLVGQNPTMRVGRPATPAEVLAIAAEAAADRARMGAPRIVVGGREPWDLVALAHARVVLAMVPRLPDDVVRFPGIRRTYADISPPHGPAELSARVDELERQVWLAATGHRVAVTDPAVRRTYGFFDAADRLGSRAFGIAA